MHRLRAKASSAVWPCDCCCSARVTASCTYHIYNINAHTYLVGGVCVYKNIYVHYSLGCPIAIAGIDLICNYITLSLGDHLIELDAPHVMRASFFSLSRAQILCCSRNAHFKVDMDTVCTL